LGGGGGLPKRIKKRWECKRKIKIRKRWRKMKEKLAGKMKVESVKQMQNGIKSQSAHDEKK
jgi:hypothetical protein